MIQRKERSGLGVELKKVRMMTKVRRRDLWWAAILMAAFVFFVVAAYYAGQNPQDWGGLL
jgi:hypothetical protein